MIKKRFLSFLALLCLTVSGAWAQTTFRATMKEGTEDAANWTITPPEATTTGVVIQTPITATYNGTKRAKSVKAVVNKNVAGSLNLTNPAAGQVIGDDGKNYDYASLPTGVTAVAKIFHIADLFGLALALTDEEGKMNWDAATNACAAHTPAFRNGGWHLATYDDWDRMMGTLGAGNYLNLRNGFASVGGTNMQQDWYWSGSVLLGETYRFNFKQLTGTWGTDDKANANCVRACLSFRVNPDPDPVELTSTDGKNWTIPSIGYDVVLEVEYFNIIDPTANTTDGVIYAGTTIPLIYAAPTTEEGYTMKYLVTATNERPTSTDGFSADVPTARATAITGPGTYYVWYYIDFATGDDSDISAQAIQVTVADYLGLTVSLAEGTDDADKWQGKAGEGEYQALPLTGFVAAGTAVSVKYSGTKLVKSVKATKKPGPAATVTTAPTAKTGVKAGQNEFIVNAGTASGGKMMYKVTTANTQPASTDGFSATVPTAEGLTEGTYYVWYYVKAYDTHSDSEISATGIEVTIVSLYTMAAEATSADKGKMICTDGHIHEYNKDAACTKACVAKIIYVGTTGDDTYSHGLALALNDEANTMQWQPAIDACAAKNNTNPVTGAKWLLASQDQWNYMRGADGAGNDAALKNAFKNFGGSNLKATSSDFYYWSSTANPYNSGGAYRYSFYIGTWYSSAKTYKCCVRACLVF